MASGKVPCVHENIQEPEIMLDIRGRRLQPEVHGLHSKTENAGNRQASSATAYVACSSGGAAQSFTMFRRKSALPRAQAAKLRPLRAIPEEIVINNFELLDFTRESSSDDRDVTPPYRPGIQDHSLVPIALG